MSLGSGWCCKAILASGVIGGPWKEVLALFYFTSWKLGVLPSVGAKVGVCAYAPGPLTLEGGSGPFPCVFCILFLVVSSLGRTSASCLTSPG